MKRRKVNLGFIVSIFCILVIPTVILSLAFFPSPMKQVQKMEARQPETELEKITKIALQPRDTELRVAYGKEGSAEPHIVRIAPLPQGGHEILEDLGKIEK